MKALLALATVFASIANTRAQLSPADALNSFQLADDSLRIELVAAEPLVGSPCAMAFDKRGRLFVAENRGYPNMNAPPQGRIAMLEDMDGDGRIDKRTTFADGLTFPNGVMPWRGGLIVTCAPDVLYFQDTDGDGKADDRKVLLTGFATSGSTQLRVNCPTLGPDGWIYFAAGLSGGNITSPEHPERPALKMTGDLRWQPFTGEIENVDGRSQYGMSFDDYGRRFICMNRVPVQHVVLSSKVLARNPHLAFSETVQDCSERTVKTGLRGGGDGVRLFPISQNITTADSHAGSFSAACGITIWRGGALPEKYRGCAFTCDPTANLVHVDRLEPRGATFSAVPMFEKEQREFLASRDDWFRPVFLASGPDGALYVCDMYRQTIEHPDYLPEEVRKRTDFESGKETGRIWRIGRRLSQGRISSLTAVNENGDRTVEQLQAENAWRRDTAFRRIIEDKDSRILAALRARLATGSPNSAALAFRALWCLKELTIADCEIALSESEDLINAAHSGVTTASVEIGKASPRDLIKATALDVISREEGLARSLATYVPPHIIDNFDPRPTKEEARRGALWSSWKWRIAESREPLLRQRWIEAFGKNDLFTALTREFGDRWLRAAVLAHADGMSRDFLSYFLQDEMSRGGLRPRPTPDLILELAKLASMEDQNIWHISDYFIGGFRRYGFDLAAAYLIGISENSKIVFFSSDEALLASDRANERAVRETLREASDLIRSRGTSIELRVLAAQLLGRAPPLLALDALSGAITDGNPPEVRAAAFDAVLRIQSEDVEKIVKDPEVWRTAPPKVRHRMSSALLASRHAAVGLDLITSNVIPAHTISASIRQTLRKHKDPTIRERAEKLFGQVSTGDRQKALQEAKAVLALAANGEHGREVFKTHCAICHRLEREGVAVGPDLLDIRNQPKESILFHLVVPDAEIAPAFAAYFAETKDGRALIGVLVSETPTGVQLRMAGGAEETLLRGNLAKLEALPNSLMPAGLEATMSRQDLADLVAFLKGER